MVVFHGLSRDDRAATATEFALLLPLLLLFLFGIIDAGRFMWHYNKIEKATQVGVRKAVVTDIIPVPLATTGYVGQTVNGVVLTQGDRIPAEALDPVICTRDACNPEYDEVDSAAFDAIVARMQTIMPELDPDWVTVEYRGSGLGFAGDPNGIEISPLVTVAVEQVPFQPLTTFLFSTMTLPRASATLTAEDLSGSTSN